MLWIFTLVLILYSAVFDFPSSSQAYLNTKILAAFLFLSFFVKWGSLTVLICVFVGGVGVVRGARLTLQWCKQWWQSIQGIPRINKMSPTLDWGLPGHAGQKWEVKKPETVCCSSISMDEVKMKLVTPREMPFSLTNAKYLLSAATNCNHDQTQLSYHWRVDQ